VAFAPRDTLFTGTVRKDHGIPDLLRVMNLQFGASAFARFGSIFACKFSDNKRVLFPLDTAGTARCRNVTRIRRRGVEETVTKPVSLINYSLGMGGVDRMDSAVTRYMANRKSLRWFRKLAFHMLVLLVFQRLLAQGHRPTGERHWNCQAGRQVGDGPAGCSTSKAMPRLQQENRASCAVSVLVFLLSVIDFVS
jgi:hypothetical protein